MGCTLNLPQFCLLAPSNQLTYLFIYTVAVIVLSYSVLWAVLVWVYVEFGLQIIYLLWPIFVYYPLTHWIRGKGWLHDYFGIVDQSGSLTVHTSTGNALIRRGVGGVVWDRGCCWQCFMHSTFASRLDRNFTALFHSVFVCYFKDDSLAINVQCLMENSEKGWISSASVTYGPMFDT